MPGDGMTLLEQHATTGQQPGTDDRRQTIADSCGGGTRYVRCFTRRAVTSAGQLLLTYQTYGGGRSSTTEAEPTDPGTSPSQAATAPPASRVAGA